MELGKNLDHSVVPIVDTSMMKRTVLSESLEYTPAQTEFSEADLAAKIDSFYDDPLGFVLFAFPWGDANIDGSRSGLEDEPYSLGPDTWQIEQLEEIRQQIVEDPINFVIRDATASGHGIGKSAQTAFIILWFMSTREGAQGMVTAGTWRQLSDKTWKELNVWHNRLINKHWFRITNEKIYRIGHEKTWFVAALANNKDKADSFQGLHGEHVLVMVDEASQIEKPIWDVIDGALTTTRAMLFAYGNPTKNTGQFREFFRKLRHRYTTRQIDSRTCRMTNKKEIRKWEEDNGEDSDYFRVRVRGVFPSQSDMQFIPGGDVTAAQQRVVQVHPGSIRLMGVDVARYGSDKSAIARIEGRKVYPLQYERNRDLMTLAAWIGYNINEYQPHVVYVDETGIGGGVVDKLLEMRFDIIGVNAGAGVSTEFKGKLANLRTEMWWNMREFIKTAELPKDDDLFQDLTSPEYRHHRQSNLLLIESKEEMKARGIPSPDGGDAVALCFAYPAPSQLADQYVEPDESEFQTY